MSQFLEKYGPWALVTGASSGIGREFARQLAAKGLNILAIARRKDLLDDLCEELAREYQIQALPLQIDLTDENFLPALREACATREIGLLINNAGVMPTGNLGSIPPVEQGKMVQLNCRAPLLLTCEFVPAMAARGKGGVIFLASMAAYQGAPYMACYSATKAFNLLFAEGLRYELGKKGIDVLALCPGLTATELLSKMKYGNTLLKPMSVEPVVRGALNILGRKGTYVPGLKNRTLNFFTRLFPRDVSTAIYGYIMEQIFPSRIK